MAEAAPGVTRAWVLHPDLTSDRDRRAAGPALEEAVALAAALPGIEIAGSQIVRLAKPHPGLLFGTGKIDELKTRLHDAEIELVLAASMVLGRLETLAIIALLNPEFWRN